MGIEAIGAVIAGLRKNADITQDELAKAVGVSAQAVSKWENGGVPDTELLPKIADYFKVSIDALFGRSLTDYGDLRSALIKKVSETPNEDIFGEVFELCWDIERAMFGEAPKDGSVKDYEAALGADEQRYSSVLYDKGFTRMGIANRLQYFLLVPDVENKDKALLDGIDYISLFKLLSDKDVFDSMVFLNKRPAGKSFSPNLLVKNIGVDFDRALEIIKSLHKYGMIITRQIEMDDVTQEVYQFNPTPSFPALLIFARELIDRPGSFSYFMGGRNRPYLA